MSSSRRARGNLREVEKTNVIACVPENCHGDSGFVAMYIGGGAGK
jgi:hypothetical protein